MSSVKRIRTVSNACVVFEAIANHQPVGVSELARTTGIDKSAVQRLAVTLHEAGWIVPVQHAATRWQVAPAFASLVRGAAADSLVARARFTMELLRDETGETVLLAGRDDAGLVVLETAESRQAVRLSTSAGARLPVATSAAGRAIAAHLPPDQLDLLRSQHPGLTDELLEQVRRRGWAQNDREVDVSARTVGAPILDRGGVPLGAVVVCAPAFRLPLSAVPRLGRRCASAAAHIAGTDPEPG